VEIGFSSNQYDTIESDGRVNVQVEIVSGSIQPGITVPLAISFENGTAISEFLSTNIIKYLGSD